jgi:hypothetical protein
VGSEVEEGSPSNPNKTRSAALMVGENVLETKKMRADQNKQINNLCITSSVVVIRIALMPTFSCRRTRSQNCGGLETS